MHVNKHFFPQNKKGWYKAKVVSEDVLSMKLKMVINEVFLSAYVLNSGQKLYNLFTEAGNNVTLSLETLQAGYYFVNVYTTEGVASSKLIKE